MPTPAKRVAAPSNGFDATDLFAMEEEKKAMVIKRAFSFMTTMLFRF